MRVPSIGLALLLSATAGTLAAVLIMKPLPPAHAAVEYYAAKPENSGDTSLDGERCLGYVALNLEMGSIHGALAVIERCRKHVVDGELDEAVATR